MRRTFLITLGVAILMAAVCAGLLAYGWWFERPGLRYEELPWPTTVPQVRAGQVIPVRVRRCNDSNQVLAYTISHALHALDSDARYVMEPRVTTMEPSTCETVTSEINEVPTGVPPGRYRVVGAGIVLGSLRTFVVPWTSQPFEVTQ